MKNLITLIDFYGGVTSIFTLSVVSPFAFYTFDIVIVLWIDLVCTYNLAMDFVINKKVKKSSMNYQWPNLTVLLHNNNDNVFSSYYWKVVGIFCFFKEKMRGGNVPNN